MNIRTALALLGACLSLASFSARAQDSSGGTPRLGDLRGAWQASFNQDASRVVVLLRSGKIALWDVENGTPVAGDLGVQTPAESFVMSPDGKTVFVSFEKNARVFDATSGTAVSPILDLPSPGKLVVRAFFSPDGQTLLACEATEVSIWKVQSGEKIAKLPLPAPSENDSDDTTPSARFTKDGAICFLHDGRGTVTKLDPKTWQPVGKPMKHPPAESAYDFYFEVSDDGKWIATTDSPGENGPKANLQIWDATATKALGAPTVTRNGFAVEFLPGWNRVVVGPARGPETTVRELPSLKVLYKIRPHDELDEPDFMTSADGKWLLSWGPDHFLNLYDTGTGKLAQNTSAAAKVSKVIMSPDSTACYVIFDNSAFLTEGYWDHYAMKMSLSELKITGSARIEDFVLSASLSPDGRRLIILQGGSDKERVTIFETASMKPMGAAKE